MIKAIEAKLAAKETAEQETEAEETEKGSVVERFEGAVLVGDSVATGFLDYQILDADSIVALRGLRTDTAGKEIEKALELTPKVLFLSIGLNDLEYCRGDSGLFIRQLRRTVAGNPGYRSGSAHLYQRYSARAAGGGREKAGAGRCGYL